MSTQTKEQTTGTSPNTEDTAGQDKLPDEDAAPKPHKFELFTFLAALGAFLMSCATLSQVVDNLVYTGIINALRKLEVVTVISSLIILAVIAGGFALHYTAFRYSIQEGKTGKLGKVTKWFFWVLIFACLAGRIGMLIVNHSSCLGMLIAGAVIILAYWLTISTIGNLCTECELSSLSSAESKKSAVSVAFGRTMQHNSKAVMVFLDVTIVLVVIALLVATGLDLLELVDGITSAQ